MRHAAIFAMLALAACAGRAPAPVQTVQIQDTTMACEAIQAEIAGNTARMADLGQERGLKVAQNVVAGVAGAFFILPWFLMDFQNSASIDERALQSRNQYLATLALQRCPQVAAAPAVVR